jgi:hypothetical protein
VYIIGLVSSTRSDITQLASHLCRKPTLNGIPPNATRFAPSIPHLQYLISTPQCLLGLCLLDNLSHTPASSYNRIENVTRTNHPDHRLFHRLNLCIHPNHNPVPLRNSRRPPSSSHPKAGEREPKTVPGVTHSSSFGGCRDRTGESARRRRLRDQGISKEEMGSTRCV